MSISETRAMITVRLKQRMLKARSELELPHQLAYVLIDRYLDRLGQGQFREIAREIKVSEQEVRQATHYIRKTLHPYPAHTYLATTSTNPTIAVHLRPDIIIRKADPGFEVELIEEKRYRFSIGSGYGTQPLSFDNERIDEEVQRYTRHYSERAKFFIECVHRRWQTLKRIARGIPIARRTVTKYREEIGIRSSRER